MVTESVIVGRKTPRDGKLEVSAALATTLGGQGAQIVVHMRPAELRGTVTVMECTCARAATSGKHTHHFVECDGFRELAVAAELRLHADAGRLDVVLG